MNPQNIAPLSILTKKVEQNETQHEVVSRRRLAFRPNSLKKTMIVSTLTQDSDTNTTTGDCGKTSPAQSQQANIHTTEIDKSRRILWTSQEQTIFYEALKIHGKDFETIVRFMAKRKFSKDKEQIKNYYINTFKLLRGKAQIDETEWTNVSKDARELFVLINGFEWRKRLTLFPTDQQKFKNLIFDGVVSFRPKRKRFLITIRTPYCPALSKFFPHDKRNVDIPSHLILKLKPLRNRDFEFVISCRQNPFLRFNVNINDRISTIFNILQRKWSRNNTKILEKWNISATENSIKFHVQNGIKFNKILFGIDEDTSPLLSVNRMKKDFESKRNESLEHGKQIEMATAAIKAGKFQFQRDTISISSDVFEINEEKIRLGLTKDNIGNASFLQLYYLLGMNVEIVFDYEISECNGKFTPWEQFISLVARDYDDRMAKSTTNSCESQQLISDSDKPEFSDNLIMDLNKEKNKNTPRGNEKQYQNIGENIVEEDNRKFIKQIKEHAAQQRKAKRLIKLVPDSQRKMQYASLMKPSSDYNREQALTIQGGMFVNLHGKYAHHSHGQNTDLIQQFPSTSQPYDRAIDFSVLNSISLKTNSTSDELPNNTITELNNELTLESTPFSPFHSHLLDNSPNKSLPEDVRNACEQMLKESSIDYCRKFEKLTRMHLDGESPLKASTSIDNSFQHF